MKKYLKLPKDFLNFKIRKNLFQSEKPIIQPLWPFLEHYRDSDFKIIDVINFYKISEREAVKLVNYLIEENYATNSTPVCNYANWEVHKQVDFELSVEDVTSVDVAFDDECKDVVEVDLDEEQPQESVDVVFDDECNEVVEVDLDEEQLKEDGDVVVSVNNTDELEIVSVDIL